MHFLVRPRAVFHGDAAKERAEHAQFDASPFSPECQDYNQEVAKFFDAHVGR